MVPAIIAPKTTKAGLNPVPRQCRFLRRLDLSRKIVRRHFSGLAILHQFLGNFLAISQTAHASPLHCGNMHEDICTAVIWLDEAKPLCCAEPFYGTSCHLGILPMHSLLSTDEGALARHREFKC